MDRFELNAAARRAGVLHLGVIALGIFSFAYVPAKVRLRGDVADVAETLVASETLFRAGVLSHVLSQVLVVFLVFALYQVFAGARKPLGGSMIALALVAVATSVINEVNSLAALDVVASTGGGVFSTEQLQSQAMHYLQLHRRGIMLAQMFWGLWMIPLSVLIWQSRVVPRFLAAPVLVAGVGYLVESGAQLLWPGALVFSQYTAGAELLLPLWLLVRGVQPSQEARP